MRILLTAGALLAVGASAAHADERRTAVSLGAVFGAESHRPASDGDSGLGRDFGGPRLTLAWEPPPLPYPDRPGYAAAAGLVPELIAGAFLTEEQAEGMIGVGLRGELRLAQKQQGMFRVSLRGVFYVAGRALVVGDRRDFFGELVIGEHILLGRAARIGFEVGGARRRADGASEARTGIVGQIYAGWQL